MIPTHREGATDTQWVFSGSTDLEKQAFRSKMLKAIPRLSFWDLFVVDPWNGVLTRSQMDIEH